MSSPKPIVLHLGDPIKYNPNTYALLEANYTVIRPSTADRQRPAFLAALRQNRWGSFAAILRPFWSTGGEMGLWDAELIAALPPSVRVFASAGAGFDWADTQLLAQRGIIYCNGGLAAAESVADFAVAMVLSTFRQLPWVTAAALLPYLNPSSKNSPEDAFKFSHEHTTAHARNPRGHKLGLIGLGKIGQLVAAKLGNPAMGMVVHYHDIQRKPAAIENGAVFHPTLRSLMENAGDCIVLATPASPDGKPLITRETLGWLPDASKTKATTRFVNVARGSLVDEEAVVEALESGRLSCAALDVHANEPRVHPRLLALAGVELAKGPGRIDEKTGLAVNPGRVMLTCHNAGGTVETHIGFEELAMRNVMAVLGGKDPITPVNLHFMKNDKRESRL